MPKKSIRILALVMVLLFLCPLLVPMAVHATEDETGRRFLFETLQGDGVLTNEDGTLTVTPGRESTVLTTQGVAPIGTAGSTNAIYVAVLNDTSATLRLTVEYVSTDSVSRHKVEMTFAPGAQKQTAWQYAPYISSLQEGTELDLTFKLEGKAEADDAVTLYSFYDVSVYDPSEDGIASTVVAEIEECYYQPGATPEEGTVNISGTIPSIFEDDDSTLALFAFGPNDQDSSDVITKTPVARMAISKTFSFSVAARSAEEIYAKYAVAVVTKEGERRLLCQPIYPDIRTQTASDTVGFKGLHTESIFSVLDSGADLEIVDVYLDRLLLPTSDSGDSILYAGDHSYYFFSEAEIYALDHRVRNLTGNGCQVYLRFLVSATATGLSYVNQADSTVGIVNKGVDIKTETALLDIHALTDFLTQRYYGSTFGSISGIILGRAADRSATYSYLGVQNLAAYAEKYATYLNLVAGTAQSNVPGLRIVVPLSDRSHTDTVSLSDLTGDYFSDLFLESLTAAMEDLILTPPQFSILLQADDSATDRAPDDIGPLSAVTAMVRRQAAGHSFVDSKIFYAWSPCEQYTYRELNEAYALRYVTLFFDENVHCFLVDLSLHEGAQQVTEQLKYLVSVIDTSQGQSSLQSLQTLYPAVFADHDLHTLTAKRVDRITAREEGYGNGKVALGSYALFDFSQLGSQATWYAGGSCGAVAVADRKLTAQLSATAGEYAEIAYAFNTAKNYTVAPLLRFSLGITATESNAQTPYEVQIRLVSNGRVLIASGVITAGSSHNLYLDLGGYTDHLEQLSSIRILTRPLNGSEENYELYLNSVRLESATLSSAELTEQISIHTNEAPQEQDTEAQIDYTIPLLITGAVVLISLILTAVLIIKHLHTRRRIGP